MRKIQAEIDQLMGDQRKFASEKDVLLMKKHTHAEMANNPNKRKKFYADEIQKLSLSLGLTQKEQLDCQNNVKLAKKMVD